LKNPPQSSFGSTKRPQIAKAILNKKINAESNIVSNFKLYYRAIAIKTA
jgi:hypothetical protein